MNQNKYRSKIDIMASILESIAKENKISITKLTYRSSLSHRQIVTHIRPLITEQLLENQNKTYSITHKGREFLEIYHNLEPSRATRSSNDQLTKLIIHYKYP
jgi:predicted transcriptional regulator